MSQSDQPDQELRSWKEIAAYLGKSVRTVQTWETRLGLPVRRLATGGRDEIIATKHDLDIWRQQRLKETPEPEPEPESDPAPPIKIRSPRSYKIPALVLCGLIVSAGTVWLFRALPPHSLRFEDATLSVRDAGGKEIWSYGFPVGAQGEMYTPAGLKRLSWIGDIDGDGEKEVLFVYRSLDAMTSGTPLFCFSQRGTVKWQYIAGRPLTTDRGETFSGVYFSSIAADPEHHQVIVRSNHSIEHPYQITMLDSAGKVLGEYWHPGHLNHTATADVDKDGKDDLLFAGVNNDAGKAALVALDREKLSRAGTAPEGTLDQLCEASKKLQKRVVLFPRSCITKKFHKYNRAYQLFADSKGVIVNVSQTFNEQGEYVIYNLSSDLELLKITVSDSFLSMHKNLEAEGKLDHAFSSQEYEELKKILVIRR